MKVVETGSARALNMRQLLNPLFFSPVYRHPDSTRQRGARQWARDVRAARKLKRAYVPLCFVAQPEPFVVRWDGSGAARWLMESEAREWDRREELLFLRAGGVGRRSGWVQGREAS